MIGLCRYKEYGYENEASIKEVASENSYPGKDKIVSYLKNNGKSTMVGMKLATDRITGERIKELYSIELLNDGTFSWWSDLAYHVEKYNLRLPKAFEDYVLNLDDYLDDNVVIPEYIKKMSLEKIESEIARLEAEDAKEKERILKTQQK